MRIGILGRTSTLIATANRIVADGHQIGLVVSPPDQASPNAGISEFRALADRSGCDLLAIGRFGSGDEEVLRAARLDIGLSVNFPTRVPQGAIDCFPMGILNAHGGDLPKYRGNACQAWAILNGESEIGLCVHRMTGHEIDAGEVVVRDSIGIDLSMTVTTVLDWMRQRIPDMFSEAIRIIDTGDSGRSLQSVDRDLAKGVSRCFPRIPEDGRIDWGLDAVSVIRLVKASTHPYAGAFCRLDEHEITIWDAEPWTAPFTIHAVPGQVVSIGEQGFAVATGRGCVMVTDASYRDDSPNRELKVRSLRLRLR